MCLSFIIIIIQPRERKFVIQFIKKFIAES